MEVLQCDGCDFRADSNDELKVHIQDVHTVFLQPTDVGNESPPRSDSLNSFSHTEEDEEDSTNNENESSNKTGYNSFGSDSGHFSSSNQTQYHQRGSQSNKTTSSFFQCKFCVRYFRSRPLLNEHTKKIHGVPAYPVDGKSSSMDGSKLNMLMMRGVDKLYSCQYCSYKSPRRGRLLKHQKLHHKASLLPSPVQADAEVLSVDSDMSEEREDLTERSVLDSMIKPRSRGSFNCEWCGFETLQRQQLCDHMMKKHRNMVKIMVSLQRPKADGSAGSSKSDSPRSTPTSNAVSVDLSGNEGSSAKGGTLVRSLSGISNFKYSQFTGKIPNSTGSSILSNKFLADSPSLRMGLDSSMMNNSRSSSDEELNNGDPTYSDAASADESSKLLLSEEDNKLLETEGIPIRRHLNMFQCPFCPFLAKHHRSVCHHIESIHLSKKTTLYRCSECPFLCTNPTKLATHRLCHGAPSEWEIMDLTCENPSSHVEPGSVMNGKKFMPEEEQSSHRCSLCNFSTSTLKGLRVHQQHKHSYCDSMQASGPEDSLNEQPDSESESYGMSNFVQKTQTSILGFSARKQLGGKTARKSINDLPLDLSPVKKRTRIDEIANNLQSKISRSQQHDDVINLEDAEDEEDDCENQVEELERENPEIQSQRFTFSTQHLYVKKPGLVQKRKRSLQVPRNICIEVTVSDEEDGFDASADPKDFPDQSREMFQEGAEYTAEPGALFYCKHCEYQNKSARSVSTHYQRMHPYIKFSFKYILDPEDRSAVFRCLECFVEYNNFTDLHQHYMDHHPEASNVLNFNQPDLVYTCRFCSYTSPNVRSLMPHYQRMHPSVKINNAMIFSSYIVDQPQKATVESQTLREILNSGPKNFTTSTSTSTSSSSPALKRLCKTPESSLDSESFKETVDGHVVVYDCDMCSFASPNMHSVLVHYQKKHPEQKASYFRIQKTMRVVSVDRAQPSSVPAYNLSSTPKPSNTASSLSLEDEVYYCKHCVYNNRSVVGVLVHYQKRHPEIKVTAKYIKHAPPTPGLMKLMEELQIAPPKQFLKQFSNLEDANHFNPKATSDKGEGEMLFFCQHCDYGNRTVKGVLIHYQKKHKDIKANADLVRRHTAVVRSQRERAQMKQTGGSTSTMTSNSNSDSEKLKPLRSLKCRHCTYASPYIYALKKHLKKDHPTVKATAMTILRWAYQDGVLEAGYHCEWCIYSHAEPSGLLMHYQRRHPEHNVDYAYMASKLWAGPDTSTSSSTSSSTSTSKQAGSSDIKHYQCRDCAFEACSVWDITNHYQAVHPWAIKDDESVLINIINSSETTKANAPSPFNHQSDDDVLEVGRSAPDHHPHLLFSGSAVSNNPYQCTVCLSEYNSLHGLLTHYGKKHPGMKVKAADFAQEADINPSSVYKCRHCPYVNSRIHGVLTHYQKRHPHVKVTAEDFADDIEDARNLATDADERSKTQRQGFGAYRCKLCPYSHGTLEKLKIHYEKYHNQSVSGIFSAAQIRSVEKKEDPVPECSSGSTEERNTFDAALKELAKEDKHTLFKCQLCKYFCSTRKGIARHYRIKHNNVRAQPEGKNNVFKCALCSYTNPIRKGLAAHYQKRHDIDAYYTHCLAASKSLSDKPNKVTLPLASEQNGSAMSEELKQAVERKKCSLCSFQAFSRKSIISHYVKRHPGVFPKKQSTSKLGRYFTVIYPNDPETPADLAEAKAEDAVGWAPFRCMKCSDLDFEAPHLLVAHYNNFHSGELKRDFVTIENPVEDGDELYQCTHCEIKFLTLPELSVHLSKHNEEIERRVPPQERRKQTHVSKQLDGSVDKSPIGYRCNFCVEIHPTLRAICNHLRKHVQYRGGKGGRVEQEQTEVPASGLVNGSADATDVLDVEPDVGGSEATAAETAKLPEHRCESCDRVFMSMQGLRSHERSHTAAALIHRDDKYSCQYCTFQSAFRHNLDRHVQSHHGHHKPFRCKLCPFKSAYLSRLKSHLHKCHTGENTYKCISCTFSTMTISQLKEHSLREHGEALTLPRLRAATTPRSTHTHPGGNAHAECTTNSTEPDVNDTVGYLEPPDVQQQLSHYQLASRNNAPPTLTSVSPDSTLSMGAEPVGPRSESTLSCEFCEFTSGYMQSLRRHYRDRHGGKKLFKCKDCSFFTCFKTTFMLHVEAGHDGVSEDVRELRCPFCLYHTKSKSHMIDHVLLHREERVIPLEVSRSKLSRHLDGLIFRCHKCTFTCSSRENLQQHLSKHDEPKPYECRLCYYDTKQQQQLEEHLRDEHKVIRNFELMGRVNLDQLDTLKGRSHSEEEEEEEEEEERKEEDETEVIEEEEVEEEEVEEVEEQMEETDQGEKEEEEEDEEEVLETQLERRQEGETGAESGGGSVMGVPPSPEKRFPCEFCGRTFSLSLEWERHVLRHGMTVSSSVRATSPAALVTVMDRNSEQSSGTTEA